MLVSFFLMYAVLIEALTGILKTTLTGFGFVLPAWVDQGISLLLAFAFSIFGKINLFEVLSEAIGVEFHFPAGFGIALSALVLARGSNGVHDLMKRLNPSGDNRKIW